MFRSNGSLLSTHYDVLFLSGMVDIIMMISLYQDISNYNQLETKDETHEETIWKLVHGDEIAFKSPNNVGLFCVYAGDKVSFFGMKLVKIIFYILGFLSPSNHFGLMTNMVLLWVFMGFFLLFFCSSI